MLVNCVAYQDGRKLADIEKREISNYLARPGCFVWVALRDATEAELAEMQEEFDLHPLAVEDARHGHQRPKIEEYGDSLFVVMHTIEVEGDDLSVGRGRTSSPARNYVLSVRHRTERGFQDVRARAEREPELLKHGSGYVLYALMDAVVDRYFPVLDAVEMELEKLEGRLFTPGASPRENIESLYYVKQKLTTMKHATAPAAGERRQALRRPRAERVRRAGRVLPRRVRPPGAHQPVDRRRARDGEHRDPGGARHGGHRSRARSRGASPPTPRWSPCRP